MMPDPNQISTEQPLSSLADDKLGLGIIANNISRTLLDQPLGDGMVIGLEGPWGSGKTSLLRLLANELEPPNKTGARIIGAGRPILRSFNPWLIGSRDALLPEFFDVLLRSIEEVYDPASNFSDAARVAFRQAHREIQKYGNLLDTVAQASPIVEKIPHLQGFSVTVRAMALAARETKRSLIEQKQKVTDALKNSSHRLIIVIDDLDRLEPQEAVEVLRLVKAVADFPNIYYILSYSAALLEKAVEHQLNIPDGHAYLEKLIQIEFTIPNPDEFDLRRWFRAEIDQIVRFVAGHSFDTSTYSSRLDYFLGFEAGKYLKTPRDVVRVCNAFRANWVPIWRYVDVGDYAWLTVIRLKHPELYLWVREYAEEAAQIELGASPDTDVERHLKQWLIKITGGGELLAIQLRKLKMIFPQLHIEAGGEKDIRLFRSNDREAEELRGGKRLASGHRARFYFAQQHSSGTLSPEQEEILKECLNNASELEEFIYEQMAIKRPQGSSMGAFVADRLLKQFGSLNLGQINNVCVAYSSVMDRAVIGKEFDDINQWRIWELATSFFELAITSRNGDISFSERVVSDCFGRGAAIGWLARTAASIKANPDSAGPSNEVRHTISTIILERLRANSDFRSVPWLLNFVWAWRRLGGEDDCVRFIEEEMNTENGFLWVLQGMRSWMSNNGRIFHPLSVPDTKPFFDLKACRIRLEEIASRGGDNAEAANKLIAAIDFGKQNYRDDQETFYNGPNLQ